MLTSSSLRFRLPTLALSFALLVGATSCDRNKKEDATPIYEELVATSEDQSTAENDDATIAELVEQDTPTDMSRAITTSSPAAERRSLASIGGCATRTWDPATRTLTLDFGTTNCAGIDGRMRRGQLVAVFAGEPHTPGATVTITRNNYFVNDNQHLGTKVITYTDYNVWRVQVTGGEVRFADGRTSSWACDRTVTRTAAPGVPTQLSITGSASGVNRKGNAYTANIVAGEPLVKRMESGCSGRHVFVDGKILIMNTTRNRTAYLDYDPIGGAPCDLIASISINDGPTRQFTLR
jgi:hypothetical protein